GGAALTEMLHGLRAAGAALVLVTHNVDEGLAVASQAAVMIAGRVVRRDDAAGIDPRNYLGLYRSLLLDGRAAPRPAPAMSAAV
ncbi:MAG TPA: hypothetical protein VN789_09045, partial [Casimicrobiaceae bacterium]|nr:hypothetical protein [Casimicrobiaceae bacterium]